MTTHTPSHLSDRDLTAAVMRLAGCEREATVSLIVHLAEFDARRLYLGASHPSMFTYCVEVLRLSEHAAYHRIAAARAMRAYPILLDRLRDGVLNLTTVRLLAPHLTAANHEDLVAAAARKTRREVEELVAARFPQPDVAASIRKLPSPAAAAPPLPEAAASPRPGAVVAVAVVDGAAPATSPPVAGETPVLTLAASGSMVARPLAPPVSSRPAVRPLAEDRYQIRFTATADTCKKLREAQELLRHVIPNGDPAAIFDRALTLLLEDLTRKKYAATKRPRAACRRLDPSRAVSMNAAVSPSAAVSAPAYVPARLSRHIPASLRRLVWARDGGSCAFVGNSGRRCDTRGRLEFHHLLPWAAGGTHAVENIQLRCRAHNAYESELFYGPLKVCRGVALAKESSVPNALTRERSTRPGPSSRPGKDHSRSSAGDASAASSAGVASSDRRQPPM